jgi:hypothetical protein
MNIKPEVLTTTNWNFRLLGVLMWNTAWCFGDYILTIMEHCDPIGHWLIYSTGVSEAPHFLSAWDTRILWQEQDIILLVNIYEKPLLSEICSSHGIECKIMVTSDLITVSSLIDRWQCLHSSSPKMQSAYSSDISALPTRLHSFTPQWP